jgi:hypothetical protein
LSQQRQEQKDARVSRPQAMAWLERQGFDIRGLNLRFFLIRIAAA